MITYWGIIAVGKFGLPPIWFGCTFGRNGGWGGSRDNNEFGTGFIGACCFRWGFGLTGRALIEYKQSIKKIRNKLSSTYAANCCCCWKNDVESKELFWKFDAGAKLLFIWPVNDALDTPAAKADTGITDPATFRALIWKFSMIFKA